MGSFGIWAVIDLFHIPPTGNNYNLKKFSQIEEIDRNERDDTHARTLEMMQATSRNNN